MVVVGRSMSEATEAVILRVTGKANEDISWEISEASCDF